MALDEAERPKIDAGFEEVTESEEADRREKLRTKWARLEAVVGAKKRVARIARDIVEHFESRVDALAGKAMVVCMSWRICVDLYRELVRLRPEWHDRDDSRGALKVVMTGRASDPLEWQPHIGSKARREALAKRFRDPADKLRMVLVRDMWLTGFDAPSLHAMYVDKPMRGHGLMQAIARVNRVFRDKPGGRVVDYLGLGHELKLALAAYAESGGKGRTAVDKEQAVLALREKYEICCGLFHGFDRTAWARGSPAERLGLLPAALEHVLAQEDGKERRLKAVRDLSQAFALAGPHPETARIRDDAALFQHVRAALSKRAGRSPKSDDELDHAVRQIVSQAVTSDGVVNILSASGLKKQDVSVLSEEFLREVRDMRQRNLAVELREKLLKGELAVRQRKNVVQARSFAAMLEQTIRRYQNRAVEAAQVIAEPIGERARRGAWAVRRRAGILRPPRRQRQRRAGARRRDAPGHRPGTGRDRAEQPGYRLDAARGRARASSPPRETCPAQARLSARQARVGGPHSLGAGRGALERLGRVSLARSQRGRPGLDWRRVRRKETAANAVILCCLDKGDALYGRDGLLPTSVSLAERGSFRPDSSHL